MGANEHKRNLSTDADASKKTLNDTAAVTVESILNATDDDAGGVEINETIFGTSNKSETTDETDVNVAAIGTATVNGTVPVFKEETDSGNAERGPEAGVDFMPVPEANEDTAAEETDEITASEAFTSGSNKTGVDTTVSTPEFGDETPDQADETAFEGPGADDPVGSEADPADSEEGITISEFGKIPDQGNLTTSAGLGVDNSSTSDVILLEEKPTVVETSVFNKTAAFDADEVSTSTEDPNVTVVATKTTVKIALSPTSGDVTLPSDPVEIQSLVASLEESITFVVSSSAEEGNIVQEVHVISIREQSAVADVRRQRSRAHQGSLRGRRGRELKRTVLT